MSYAIVRNEKLTRTKAQGICVHNDRKAKNHTNKEIDSERTHLHKVVNKFYETVDKFINWICSKFGIGESKELVKHFENDTNTFIDPVKQLKHEEREKEWDLEL